MYLSSILSAPPRADPSWVPRGGRDPGMFSLIPPLRFTASAILEKGVGSEKAS